MVAILSLILFGRSPQNAYFYLAFVYASAYFEPMLWPARIPCRFYTAYLIRQALFTAKGLTISKRAVYTPFTAPSWR